MALRFSQGHFFRLRNSKAINLLVRLDRFGDVVRRVLLHLARPIRRMVRAREAHVLNIEQLPGMQCKQLSRLPLDAREPDRVHRLGGKRLLNLGLCRGRLVANPKNRRLVQVVELDPPWGGPIQKSVSENISAP